MGDPVTNFEVNSSDPAKARRFYSAVLGWKMNEVPQTNYTFVDTDANGKGIGGGIGPLRRGIGAATMLTAGPLLASCAPAAVSSPTPTAVVPTATAAPTLAPPETTSIRLAAGACDSAIFGAERYLREEGFTDVQFTDAATATAIAAGNANIGNAFPQAVFNSVEGNGPKVVALGGLHPGCNEIWAQPAIASLKDLKGSTISVTAKALTNLPYSWMAMALKYAGADPKAVNFVVQADADA